MSYSNVQTGLDANAVTVLNQLLDQFESRIPFGIKLAPERRSALPTVGPRRWVFVEKALGYGRKHWKLLPGHRPIADFERVAFDYKSLSQLLDRIDSIREILHDTSLQIGANYFDHSLTFYNIVSNDTSDQPGTESVQKDLAIHFERKNGKDVFIEDPVEPAPGDGNKPVDPAAPADNGTAAS